MSEKCNETLSSTHTLGFYVRVHNCTRVACGWLLNVGSRRFLNPPQYIPNCRRTVPAFPCVQAALETQHSWKDTFMEGNTLSLFLQADKKRGNDQSAVRGPCSPLCFCSFLYIVQCCCCCSQVLGGYSHNQMVCRLSTEPP